MSKILVVSDLHLHDYPQRNPSDKFRLYQSRTVCKNIIEAGKREGCEIIVLAGDILEKSIIRPYIQAEVKRFLDTLMSNFKFGYVVWGNHDQDNKSSDQDFTDSCLSVMLPKNLYYADKQITKIDNTTIAFSNWRPDFDLTFIPDKVDVLFTHATINYGGGDIIKSQVLDESKFDLCISGDIHRTGQVGKYVSIGIPQKCKMGDSDESTGIVFDCSTKEWKYVNLNPNNNLMRFAYVNVLGDEGWDPETGTWKVYKRDTVNTGNGRDVIEIPQWEEIDHLVTEIISKNALADTHSEVLSHVKDISKNEVDFGFTLQRFACKNWRSIDDIELWFNDGDKILITGKNGSGKSSLLSALKYAFVENRSLKDFVQFGTKECSTEVDFIYQGNLYRILRGYNSTKGRSLYGLWVWQGDEPQPMKYNNKKEFENDLLLRFPFIQYIDDVMFFDPDHNKLLADISKKEIDADIISKFFKLDKIDTLNEQAQTILDAKTKDVSKWEEEKKSALERLDYINSHLSMIHVPDTDKNTLLGYKMEGMEIQRRSKEWSDYVIFNSTIQAKKSTVEDSLGEKQALRASCRNMDDIEADIQALQSLMNDISTIQIPALTNITREIDFLRRDVKKLKEEGTKLYEEWVSLGEVKICPTCHQEIKGQIDLESLKADLEVKIGKTKIDLDKKMNELALKESENSNTPFKIMSLQQQLNEYQIKMNTLGVEKNRIPELDRDIARLMNTLDTIQAEIDKREVPPAQTLPDNFMETMSKIEQEINAWNSIESYQMDLEAAKSRVLTAEGELDKITREVSNLERYIKLTGGTGKIFEEIMTRLADEFSDNQVKYEVYSGQERKKDKLKLLSYFNNKGNWVAYENCSSGQKTILDIHYLSKIITRMGFLVMDEFLKHLDPLNHDICIDMISQCNVGCIMLSSHMESIANFHNKTCSLELNDSGSTIIKLE